MERELNSLNCLRFSSNFDKKLLKEFNIEMWYEIIEFVNIIAYVCVCVCIKEEQKKKKDF